ncbi:MAG: hypothetical protein GY725_01780, partial [bacterium]|nr:hypothetical protein [bacterium]
MGAGRWYRLEAQFDAVGGAGVLSVQVAAERAVRWGAWGVGFVERLAARSGRGVEGEVMNILYHESCMDGSAAALIALQDNPGAKLIPMQYGDPPPDGLKGEHVVIVDFSFKRELTECLIEESASFLCLDHHKTAEEELRGLPDCIFDMDRSGARMAWDYWNPDVKPPWWVLYIEDRDLWRWKLGASRAINASLRSYGLTVDALRDIIDADIPIAVHEQQGRAILRYQQQVIEQHVRHAEDTELLGHVVPVVNATCLFSEIVGELAKGKPFAASYFVKSNGERVYQLRSDEDGFDVGALA